MEKLNSPQELGQKLLEDHKALEQAIGQIYKTLQSPLDSSQIKTIQGLISSIKDRLVKHFELEESDGILNDLLSRAPNIGFCVQSLFGEHQELKDEINLIHKRCQDLTPDKTTLFEQCHKDFMAFVSKLRNHDSQENILILDAYNLDMGGGD